MTLAPSAIEMSQVEHRFGATPALLGFSLTVSAGELVGLIGPDAAGKTTAMRILAGMMAPDQGTARVCGLDPLGSQREVRKALGYMPQQYSLYGDLSVAENLAFFARMFGLDKAGFRERRQRLLAITRLERFTDRRADALSGGMYKKLALACALLHNPRVLLLDEPTNGVDPVSRRELWNLLLEFVAEGMAVLIATPYMDEATRCQRVGLIDHGRMLLSGKPEELLAGFEEEAFEIQGCPRAIVEKALQGAPEVLALSPAGERIRIVIQNGLSERVRTRIRGLGGVLVPTRADFDDLFLVQTSRAKERTDEQP